MKEVPVVSIDSDIEDDEDEEVKRVVSQSKPYILIQ